MARPQVSYGIQVSTGRLEAGRLRARAGALLSNASVGWLLPLALLALWQIAADRVWAPAQILPPPGSVVRTLREQLASGELLNNFSISLARVGAGFLLGAQAGIVLGVSMGLFRRVEEYVHPAFKAISQVPVLGWLPLAMMVLGIGEALKVVIIAQASLVPVALSTLKGIRGVPVALFEVGRAFRFSNAQLLRKVVLPGAVPSIFVGIRYGLTQAWLSLVTVELLASSEGLGFLIVWGRQLFQLDLVLSAILVVGLVGLVLDKGIERLERWLLRWRPDVAASASEVVP